MQKLKITNCKNHIEEFTLAGGSYTFGRSLDSTLRLEGEEVSRLHAKLLVNSTRCELIDEGSKNGTLVNGNRITSRYLNDGDTIKIGRFNLKYISDTIKPEEKSGVRHHFFPIIGITLILLVFSGFSFYQNKLTKKTLAQRTAQYLAERNKEALYLGEYASIDLTNLPQDVIQVAIWDRNGILRAGPQPEDGQGPALTIPIYYESVMVGKLWMRYKL